MTIDEMLDAGEEQARRVLIGTKEALLPMFHVELNNGDGIVVGTPWANEEEKYATVDAIKHAIKNGGVKRYSFVAEAWMSTAPKTWKPGQGRPLDPPSQQPNRVECVIITACERERQECRFLEIKRGPGGRCADLIRQDDMQGEMGGALFNLFK